jgi:tetratricopeptide (TPR) repeat protein
MISINEALVWLNKFDKSHLNGINQQLIVVARNSRTDNGAVIDILKAALSQAKATPQDDLDYPETLLNCAAIELDREFKLLAKEHVEEAKQIYHVGKDPQGETVACWMCGIIDFQLPDIDSCYLSFGEALESLKTVLAVYRHAPETLEWYHEIRDKMNQDLVTIPHDCFTWLTRFPDYPSHLSTSNRLLVDALNVNLQNKQFTQSYSRITELKDSAYQCPDHLEVAEIFVETAFAAYRMANPQQAIKDLQYALRKYPVGSHYSEVTRWMMGAVQWSCADERIKAKGNWQNCIGSFKHLALKADRMNKQSEKNWYNEKVKHMEGALREKVKEYL